MCLKFPGLPLVSNTAGIQTRYAGTTSSSTRSSAKWPGYLHRPEFDGSSCKDGGIGQ